MRKKGKKNIIDEQRMRIDEMKAERQKRAKLKSKKQEQDLGPALARFAKKGA